MKWLRDRVAIARVRDLNEITGVNGNMVGVLNVAREIDWYPLHPVPEYAKVPLSNDVNGSAEMMAAGHVLNGLVQRHGRAIVACACAVNRSPIVAAIWCAQQYRLSWRSVVEEVQAVRSHLDFHRGLLKTVAAILSPHGPTQAEIDKAVY